MLYVPVLRHRSQERGIIKKTAFSKNMMPLIEVILEKPHSRLKGEFASILHNDLANIGVPFMVDFPMNLNLRKAKLQVRTFLEPIYSNLSKRLDRYNLLLGIDNLIPVISYNPEEDFNEKAIIEQRTNLSKGFSRLAYRLFPQHGLKFTQYIKKIVTKNDIILLDIDEIPYKYPPLSDLYTQVTGLAKQRKTESIIISSPISANLRNKDLPCNKAIDDADNGLLKEFKTYGFTGFGDYVGIKRDPMTDGWGFSPGFIFYSWRLNSFIGYRGSHSSDDLPAKKLAEFKNTITPKLLGSKHWKSYSDKHHQECPGCNRILRISNGEESGASQAKWKGISMAHYIYTMQEFL